MECDVLIVGGGIAGASIAFEIAPSLRTILVEREQAAGYHTTGRSVAVYSETYGNDIIRRLTTASREFFVAPPSGFADVPLTGPRGSIYIAGDEQRPRLDQFLRDASTQGAVVETLTASEVVSRVPILRKDYVAAGAIEPGAMDIDVAALHQGYLRGAKARGATILTNAEVVAADRRGDRWIVQTTRAIVSTSTVVNAAGAWADQLAGLLGAGQLGLSPLRRTVAIVDAPAGADIKNWPFVVDIDETFYFKPESGQILISPTDETLSQPCDAQPEEIDIAIAIDRLQRVAHLPVRRVNRAWAGLRSFFPDRTPCLGYDDAVPGFFWAAGQGGYGIQAGPALAKLAAALIGREAPPPWISDSGIDLARLAPARLRARGVLT